MFKSHPGNQYYGGFRPPQHFPEYMDKQEPHVSCAPVYSGTSASRAATPLGHSQHQSWYQQQPYPVDEADHYGPTAWARMRTPSPECLHRGFGRGYPRRQQPQVPAGGSSPMWNNMSVPPQSSSQQQPQRRPVQHPQQQAVNFRAPPAKSEIRFNGLRMQAPAPAVVPRSGKHTSKPVEQCQEEEEQYDDGDAADFSEPSRGSEGHPHACKEPCKYHRKTRGCRDGANCDHCHLCKWRPSVDRLLRRRAKLAASNPATAS